MAATAQEGSEGGKLVKKPVKPAGGLGKVRAKEKGQDRANGGQRELKPAALDIFTPEFVRALLLRCFLCLLLGILLGKL